jgi:hypothetical protein
MTTVIAGMPQDLVKPQVAAQLCYGIENIRIIGLQSVIGCKTSSLR